MTSALIQKAVIFNLAGDVLMLRRSKTDIRRPLQWDLPGGLRESGEELIDSVKREILEETGLTVGDVVPVYASAEIRTWKNHNEEHEQNAVFLFYIAQTSKDEVTLSYEHDKMQWKSLAVALEEFEYELHKEVLKYILDNDLAKDALSE